MIPKISVIVPVYKAEKYLHRCVDSLLAQTFKNFEILLIDDGSPDKSGEICDEYAVKDPRVRVFHKENGGVSSARQCGIDNALGDYTIHADPDDWVEPTMLEELYIKAMKEEADMVICDIYMNTPQKQIYLKQKPTALDHETVLKELFQQLHGSCCNKLIKRACYRKYGVKFDMNLSFCEDLFYHACLLVNPVKVSYLPKAYYHYDLAINCNSVCKNYCYDSYLYDVMLYEKFSEMLKDSMAYSYAKANMGYLIVHRAFMGNIFTSNEFRKYCGKYICCLKDRLKVTSYYRWLLTFSCLGYYKLSYDFYFFIKQLIR